LLALFVPLSTGCRTLDRFDTRDGEAYCGSIVSAAFVRESFPVDMRLRMTLDTDHLSSVPGTLTSDDGQDPPCKPEPMLREAPMRVTEAMLHDPLSTFDFGTGRDHNFIAWVDSTCEGPMVAVVSLMRNDDVEVRLLKPSAPPDAGAEREPEGFALFHMTRQKDDCGF
jgi:hypothetical protein